MQVESATVWSESKSGAVAKLVSCGIGHHPLSCLRRNRTESESINELSCDTTQASMLSEPAGIFPEDAGGVKPSQADQCSS